ncbi:Vacuolar protein sorting-associated protein 70 [Marasmius tenuissimus]|uniref:Vacuolar protein sorting-associated protein 70 n=1 Tax=Marasmius tenuissimus TaxID=585030 RepID=A0ABR3A9J8_9AGAR
MSGKVLDPEKQASFRPVPQSARNQTSRTKQIVALICLSTALYGLYGFSNLWSEVTAPREVHHRPPPLGEKEKEALFLSIPSGESARSAAKTFGSRPHVAGSRQDYADAKKMLEIFQDELGIKPPRKSPIFDAGTPKSRASTIILTEPLRPQHPTAWIDVYYPELDTPAGRSVDILDKKGKSVWKADLDEDGDPLDEDAHEFKDFVAAWHGFSSNGEAEGQDYDELVEAGANFTDKIVLTRYGKIFRGLKIKGAEELGAAGVLIYSDPRDDGYVTVENGYTPYPQGPARNPTSIQRGSVMYLSKHPGDPTTPGYPAYEGAERQTPVNLARIPSLPLSWRNAQRLLEEIEEIYIPHEPAVNGRRKLSGKHSASKIRLVNHVDYNVTPIWNTMAAIPGHIKDEVVIVGCHRDAWVLGAADPISGTASLHEIVRGLGELLRQGWKPLRTILIASWDAEEHGLVGSTEYGEDFAEWIGKHAVTYVNVDVSSAGSQWNVLGSPSLAHLIKRTALDVPHPTARDKTLWDARGDQGPFSGFNGSTRVDLELINDFEATRAEGRASSTGVGALGSGSDYTVFLQRLGVASTDQGFGQTPTDAPYHYHSIYDTVRWQDEYADPGYKKHVAVAQHLGLMVLRLTDTVIVPLNTTQYAFELSEYVDKVEQVVPEDVDVALDLVALRSSIESLQAASLELDVEKVAAEKNFYKALKKLPKFPHPRSYHRCSGGFIRRVADWYHSVFGSPERPYDHIQDWMDFFSENLEDEDALSRLPFPRNPWREFFKAVKRLVKANGKVIAFERGFLDEGGIKDREWYRHLGVAPGKWLGYGATTLPALTEAIVIDRNTAAARYEVSRLVKLFEALTEQTKP